MSLLEKVDSALKATVFQDGKAAELYDKPGDRLSNEKYCIFGGKVMIHPVVIYPCLHL